MQFAISGSDFYQALQACFSLSKDRITLEALEGNKVKVSSTGADQDAALQISLSAAVKSPGKFQINQDWVNLLRNAKKEDEVIVSSTPQRKKKSKTKTTGINLYVEVSNGEASLPVFAPSEEIGGLPLETSSSFSEISYTSLETLGRLKTFTADKVNFDVVYLNPGVAYASAGNTAVSVGIPCDLECGLHPKHITEILKVFKGCKSVNVTQDGALLFFMSATTTYTCRTHKVEFSKSIAMLLDKMLTKDSDFSVDLKEFRAFLEPIISTCPMIRFELVSNLLTASGFGKETSIELEFPVEYSGEAKEVVILSEFLVNTLQGFQETVAISFNGAQPITLREGSLEAIVTPINPGKVVAGVV